ncbi:MAG: ABC transporter ATP-binding protein [bacterium]|nr:ABC transporter ATP-binding protein [bacterium]
MSLSTTSAYYDMKQAIADNRLVGLWRMMAGLRWKYIGATLSIGVSTLAKTGALLLLSTFIDTLLPREDVWRIAPLVALGFIALAVIEGGFSYLSGRWAAQTAETVARRLRNYLFDHLQRLTFAYHDKNKTGELLQRSTSDVDAIRRFYIEEGVGIANILVLFIVNFIAIMTIHVPLALASVVVMPVVLGISFYFFRKVSKKWDDFQNQEARLSTRIQENLTGVRVVKAFARQNYEIDKFEEENWKQYLSGRSLTMMHSVFWPLTDVITGIQMIGGYLLGATLALNGTITVGQYIAYVGMITWIIWPMRNLGRLVVQTSTGLVSFDRVMELIREEREPLREGEAAPVDKVRGEIVFEHVWFEYEPGNPVLKDISFQVKPGQTIALLGSTGSGKTSVMALLPRFYDYTSGSITLDGIELREFPRRFLRQNIGVVEQEPFLFSRTIRENITYGVGRHVSDEEVFQIARAADIHDTIMSFPEGYQTLVGERGVTLSGGQKQRVALARTLLKNTPILILDDATSSVDTETEASIRHALQNLVKDRTTFIIAHRITSVMHADMILVFDKGEIVQVGTHDALLMQEGIYRRIYDVQSRIEDELEREIASV